MLKVLKFGGTSVKDADSIRKVRKIILEQPHKLIVVCSALAGVTNKLERIYDDIKVSKYKEAKIKSSEIKYIHINLANELEADCDDIVEGYYISLLNIIDSCEYLRETSLKIKDMIISFGELLSSLIIFRFLKKAISNIRYIDPREIIKTDSDFTKANVDEFSTSIAIKSLISHPDHAQVLITGGFVGSDYDFKTTTIGRGGSDYTASIIGKFSHADEIEIWTDTDGIMTADPSIIEKVKPVEELNYDEALDISASGGKVIHYKTIFPVIDSKIPLRIRNTFNPASPGTLIKTGSVSYRFVKSILVDKGFIYYHLKIRNTIKDLGLNHLINNILFRDQNNTLFTQKTDSEVKLICKYDNETDKLNTELNKYGILSVIHELAVISLIGTEFLKNKSFIREMAGVLEKLNNDIYHLIICDNNIKLVVKQGDIEETIRILHENLFK